jgi:phage host-nuclease inhibitor protein Gam
LDEDFIERIEPVKKEIKKQTKVTMEWGEEENDNATNVRKIKDIKFYSFILVK